ncbi:DUF1512 domain-containing protein [Candidatus Bathyarchaeota archaeon]|nr:MAG: DUF1512 domain-containing protein [Candidatus Bathyarchaeota archaeon]
MIASEVTQAAQQNTLGTILQTLYSLAFVIYLVYAQRIQTMTMLRQVEIAMNKVKAVSIKGRDTAIEAINEIGKPERDPTPQVDRFMEYFLIEPINMDPAGVVEKLGKILDVREFTFEKEVQKMAPNATEAEQHNIENLLEVALTLNSIYKVIRHYYLLGKKTMNIYTIMQVQMVLPQIEELVAAYTPALQAFREGIPIGDSVGPIVAAKLMHGCETKEIAKGMVMGEASYMGRRLLVTKALGPGGNVGKPGDAIINMLNENEGKVTMLITVDAAGKLEGEEAGEVAEGVGAAIGGPGVEKYKIEKAAIEHGVPMYAVAIKQGMEHVVAPLTEPLFNATDSALESVKKLITDYSVEGDTVIIAGIGNTIGVAQ